MLRRSVTLGFLRRAIKAVALRRSLAALSRRPAAHHSAAQPARIWRRAALARAGAVRLTAPRRLGHGETRLSAMASGLGASSSILCWKYASARRLIPQAAWPSRPTPFRPRSWVWLSQHAAAARVTTPHKRQPGRSGSRPGSQRLFLFEGHDTLRGEPRRAEMSNSVRYPHPSHDSDARLRPVSMGCGSLYH
jgi:hypothetical protein